MKNSARHGPVMSNLIAPLSCPDGDSPPGVSLVAQPPNHSKIGRDHPSASENNAAKRTMPILACMDRVTFTSTHEMTRCDLTSINCKQLINTHNQLIRHMQALMTSSLGGDQPASTPRISEMVSIQGSVEEHLALRGALPRWLGATLGRAVDVDPPDDAAWRCMATAPLVVPEKAVLLGEAAPSLRSGWSLLIHNHGWSFGHGS
jgi:hypothetical protein